MLLVMGFCCNIFYVGVNPLSGFHSTSTSSFVREQTLNLHIVVYSHPSPSHLLLSMGTNSLDLLTNINLIENKGG